MKLSQEVWTDTRDIYHAIVHHPFNQELMHSTLPKDTFSYYLGQDALYLKDFARALALIAARSSGTPLLTSFLKFAQDALVAEQELVHQFFRKTFGAAVADKPTLATLAYTSYLLNVCALEPYEVAVAAVVPCFWIYREVGLHLANAVDNNPYARWIATYSGPEFSAGVSEVICILDQLAENTTEAIRQKMRDAFYKSSVLEWHFWHDAYTRHVFDDVMLEMSLSTLSLPLSLSKTI